VWNFMCNCVWEREERRARGEERYGGKDLFSAANGRKFGWWPVDPAPWPSLLAAETNKIATKARGPVLSPK
jgi:hypothetical protein